jgi:hypothetical protein
VRLRTCGFESLEGEKNKPARENQQKASHSDAQNAAALSEAHETARSILPVRRRHVWSLGDEAVLSLPSDLSKAATIFEARETDRNVLPVREGGTIHMCNFYQQEHPTRLSILMYWYHWACILYQRYSPLRRATFVHLYLIARRRTNTLSNRNKKATRLYLTIRTASALEHRRIHTFE